MKSIWKVLTAGCLLAAFAGGITSYADVTRTTNQIPLVTAQGDFSNIAVSQVTGYVNIREQPNTGSNIIGKIYNNCAASIEETVAGEGGTWYRIRSGTVTGYIKAQYFVTGEDAERLAQSIGREFVTVNTEGLRLREKPDLTSNVLTLLSNGARYVVQAEEGEFFKVEVDADLVGYIAKQYCRTEVEFDQALSLEEERQKLAEKDQRKLDADQAIAALEQVKLVEANNLVDGTAGSGAADTDTLIIAANPVQSDNSEKTDAPRLAAQTRPASGDSSRTTAPSGGTASLPGTSGPGSAAVVSATRTAVVAYAKQFLGCPYVYGGTSLTNGTDCSGFTQGVYAHFGITTGRSSRDQAEKGREIAVSAAQPGDLLFYASGGTINHVAMYIGGGQVIHASTPTTGITIAPYDYRTPCKAVTFLD